MGAFADAIRQALQTVNDVAGEEVIYYRGADASDVIIATPGAFDGRIESVNDVPIDSRSRDWIFDVADLVIDDAAIVPARGDRVTQVLDGVTTVYVVLSDGDEVYRYCDRARTRIRVHTKEAAA